MGTIEAAASMASPLLRPELLAPAGDWECARAAVENGADAIYFGLERFNARMRARNFTESDLPRLMEFLHERGVRGYVTFNTLVFADELAEAVSYLKTIIRAGVDAAIVQDVGICRLIRKLSPDFPIHASTQMTITSAQGVEFAKELGCNLVVLARECSMAEIEKIRAVPMGKTVGQGLPLEVFVHGALCVAYSGQCLTSEALGGRSANRGECAQACRMPYELISDGKIIPLGDKRYLLSPQDLAGLPVLPDLVKAGVASFKIEGRLKSPEYVASITRIYRQALDQVLEGPAADAPKVPAQSRYEMEMAFSRGLYTGWFGGINNQALVHARFGKKRGIFLGEVSSVRGQKVRLRLEAGLKPGDGVVFDAGHPEDTEQGGRVYTVETGALAAEIDFGRGAVDFTKIKPGDKVWKTSDPELENKVRETYAGTEPRFQRGLRLEVHGEAGLPLTVIARDSFGHLARASSAMPLAVAEKQPLDLERLRKQFSRLGGTPFKLEKIETHIAGQTILPLSELNRLRRDLVQELLRQRRKSAVWQLREPDVSEAGSFEVDSPDRDRHAPALIPLVRNLEQLAAILKTRTPILYCEMEDPKKYRDAVQLTRAAETDGFRREIWVAPPRIHKPGEEWILRQVRSSEADGYLARNYDHLQFFAGDRLMGDFSFNVANKLSAEYFMSRYRLEKVTASYDLNFAQLEALLQSAPSAWFEVTLHQHMPLFHMEHCVFCAFLSSGTNFSNCGRPCDRHEVKLRDRVGAEHVLKADAGCRNTVFNAAAQTGAEYAGRLLELGVRRFRVEFVNESPAKVIEVMDQYGRLLRGEISGNALWRELKLINQLGVTRGQMEKA